MPLSIYCAHCAKRASGTGLHPQPRQCAEFCDHVILINHYCNSTAARPPPRLPRKTRKNFRRSAAVISICRADLHDDDDPRSLTVITDDERATVFYGHGDNLTVKTGGKGRAPRDQSCYFQPFEYNYMVKAIWVSGIVGAMRAFFVLT